MAMFRTLLFAFLLALGFASAPGCQFLAGAAAGAGATEVAEEIEDDDDGDD